MALEALYEMLTFNSKYLGQCATIWDLIKEDYYFIQEEPVIKEVITDLKVIYYVQLMKRLYDILKALREKVRARESFQKKGMYKIHSPLDPIVLIDTINIKNKNERVKFDEKLSTVYHDKWGYNESDICLVSPVDNTERIEADVKDAIAKNRISENYEKVFLVVRRREIVRVQVYWHGGNTSLNAWGTATADDISQKVWRNKNARFIALEDSNTPMGFVKRNAPICNYAVNRVVTLDRKSVV